MTTRSPAFEAAAKAVGVGPGRLSVLVAPRSVPGGVQAVAQRFESRLGAPPTGVHVGVGYIAACRQTVDAWAAIRSSGSDTVIVHGELLGESGPATAAEVARTAVCLRERDTLTVARDLRGSFVIAVFGPQRFELLTDRVASRKVFRLETPEGTWIDTDPAAFADCPADPAGVASLIINRFIPAGRTLRRGVVNLPRASVHRFDGSSWSAREYWTYDFTDGADGRFAADLDARREELWQLITRAIRRRLPAAGTLSLSLSGGVDSRAILAGLLETGFPLQRLVTASYGARDDDDAAVARELAQSLGLPWALVRGSESLPRLLELNARHCGGQVFFYPRGLDGFDEYAATLPAPLTVFVGDECYGWNHMPLESRADAFRVGVGIRAPASVPAYYSYGAHSHRAIAEALQGDIDAIDRRYRHVTSLHDLKDLLYLDQRLSHMLLPWRERHLGRCARVANPHIDDDILEFMKGVPTEYRLDKRLFRETAQQHFGDLRSTRFARSGGCSNDFLDALFVRHHDEIDHDLASTPSALDEVLPPEVIRAGLAGMRADIVQRQSSAPAAVARLRRRLSAMATRLRFASTRRGLPQAGPDASGYMSIEPIQMATVLQLRQYLKTSRASR